MQKEGFDERMNAPYKWRFFIAPGLQFSKIERQQNIGFLDIDENFYEDEFIINRVEWSPYIDGGLSYNLGRITLEYYMGAGLMFRNIKHKNRENLDDKPLIEAEYFLFQYKSPKRYSIPLLKFKISLGFNF